VVLECQCNFTPNETNLRWLQTDSRGSTTVIPSMMIFNYHNTSYVFIYSVSEQDEGEYRCEEIRQNDGTVKNTVATIQVTVLAGSPVPNGFPVASFTESITVSGLGETASLECNITGDPAPTGVWYKLFREQSESVGEFNFTRVDTSKSSKYSLSSTGLTILNVSRTDKGRYQCVAKNNVGSAYADALMVLLLKGIDPVYEFEPTILIEYNGTRTDNLCRSAGRTNSVKFRVVFDLVPSSFINLLNKLQKRFWDTASLPGQCTLNNINILNKDDMPLTRGDITISETLQIKVVYHVN